MTAAEKQAFKAWFPSLDVNRAIVTGEATSAYNCIAWTLGISTAWHWPGSRLEDFDAFYARYGIRRKSAGNIAAWGATIADMRHGSIAAPVPLSAWESKCGQTLRIQHGMNELESSSYGRILAFYGRTRLLPATAAEIAAVNDGRLRVELQQAEIDRIEVEVQRVDPQLRKRFSAQFTLWKAEWASPLVALSSDPATRRFTRSFAGLAEMGPQILPLVVRELAAPENFFALQLYEFLEARAELRISPEPDSDEMIEGEQGRALRTVRRYLAAL